ncbi:hypothetical protein [Brumimicrobium oceani]|uniref:Uncharacterized protein n=1 Tax=Brumimicrobium oceani TaxID=2100725 RepID=A0A2U2XAW1_9FLAO|nr:hypothetical protein [Brumimicrobium oceani]PWH84890.1 hypothetical protein DIT68_12155 [Brumimicrobium oceani]
MNYVKISIILLLAPIMFSCEKEDYPNTGQGNTRCFDPEIPGDYFPAYANSWWSYYDENNEIFEIKIAPNYQECEGECSPILENMNRCIQGNALLQPFYAGLGTSGVATSPIYSTVLDSVLICPISFATFEYQDAFLGSNDIRYRRKATNIDTIISVNSTVYDNVLVVYEYHIFDSLHRYYDYFAKDIGLIKRDSVNAQDTTDLIEILRLKDYSIKE